MFLTRPRRCCVCLQLANPSGEEDDDDMEMDLNAEDPEGKADFRKILQRFEDAEKEDMKMIAKSLKKVGAGWLARSPAYAQRRCPARLTLCWLCPARGGRTGPTRTTPYSRTAAKSCRCWRRPACSAPTGVRPSPTRAAPS